MKNLLTIANIALASVLLVTSAFAQVTISESKYSPNAKIFESKETVIIYDVLNIRFNADVTEKAEIAGGFEPLLGVKRYSLPNFVGDTNSTLHADHRGEELLGLSGDEEINTIHQNILNKFKLNPDAAQLSNSYAQYQLDGEDANFDFRVNNDIEVSLELFASLVD